jgi:hypothetical protein
MSITYDSFAVMIANEYFIKTLKSIFEIFYKKISKLMFKKVIELKMLKMKLHLRKQ